MLIAAVPLNVMSSLLTAASFQANDRKGDSSDVKAINAVTNSYETLSGQKKEINDWP